MIITELIREQAFDCIVMLSAGVLVMIMYQVFCNTCKLVGMRPAVSAVCEIIFWALAAAITAQFLYYCAYGRLSFHAALSFTAGALLWKAVFYDIINRIYSKLCTKQGNSNKNGEKETQQSIQREQSGN